MPGFRWGLVQLGLPKRSVLFELFVTPSRRWKAGERHSSFSHFFLQKFIQFWYNFRTIIVQFSYKNSASSICPSQKISPAGANNRLSILFIPPPSCIFPPVPLAFRRKEEGKTLRFKPLTVKRGDIAHTPAAPSTERCAAVLRRPGVVAAAPVRQPPAAGGHGGQAHHQPDDQPDVPRSLRGGEWGKGPGVRWWASPPHREVPSPGVHKSPSAMGQFRLISMSFLHLCKLK